MTVNQLTARVEKIGLWRGNKKGYFFTTSEGKEFFSNGRPEFQVGQIVTILIDEDNKLKEARKAEIVSIDDEKAIRPTSAEVKEAFTALKEDVKDAKVLVREAQERISERMTKKTPFEEYQKEYREFVQAFDGGDETDMNSLWLSYRISCLERAIVDYGFNRTN